MRLHLGCGKKRLPGYINIDFAGSDMDCDIRRLPFDDGVAEEIVAIHVAEHFMLTEIHAVLTEWRRVLQYGGQIVLELPCWDKVQKLISAKAPDNLTRWALYGDPGTHKDGIPALHKWCYSVREFEHVLTRASFRNIVQETPKYHVPERDMRWLAQK